MGYHHCNIPTLKTCIKQYTSLGLKDFAKKYSKCETLVGDSDAICFVEEKLLEWNRNKQK
jgi:hypothetical protein